MFKGLEATIMLREDKRQHVHIYEQFIRHGGDVVEQPRYATTHIITNRQDIDSPPHQWCCIVSPGWVIDSIERSRLVDEDEYIP